MDIDPRLADRLRELGRGSERLTVLTGAGISAESGIPTFRGPEGYWTVGSRNYQPHQMATQAMFSQAPREVWAWYLYRRGVCRRADPNPGHHATVTMERALGDRFVLITQNVDGLHLRAGSSEARTYPIHGSIEHIRCGEACTPRVRRFPDDVPCPGRGEPVPETAWDQLACPDCGALSRPHVLWFDECYDEAWYRWDSSMQAAQSTDILLIVGTEGATTLPAVAAETAARSGALIIDVNIRDNTFRQLARHTGGFALNGPSGSVLPAVAAAIAT